LIDLFPLIVWKEKSGLRIQVLLSVMEIYRFSQPVPEIQHPFCPVQDSLNVKSSSCLQIGDFPVHSSAQFFIKRCLETRYRKLRNCFQNVLKYLASTAYDIVMAGKSKSF
jgi:hypothetical protein